MKKLIVPFLIANLLVTKIGCVGVAYKQKLVKQYYLTALDTDEEMEIQVIDPDGYAFRVIPSTVFSVGYDSSYIIAKQHPRTANNHADSKITNYYILPIMETLKSDESSNAIGPLTEEEFNKKKTEFGVNVEFSITFKNLE
jgi:hypothetical protein